MISIVLAAAVTLSFGELTLDCEKPGDWKFSMKSEKAADGAEIVTVDAVAPKVTAPAPFFLKAWVPQNEMNFFWEAGGYNYEIGPDWAQWVSSELAKGMPLYVYFNCSDQATFSVAMSDCARRVEYWGGVREEGSLIEVKMKFLAGAEAPIDRYSVKVRFDTVKRDFSEAVQLAAKWVEQASGVKPLAAPEAAFDPLYSTWYDFHQNVFAKDIEQECALAAKLGMKTLIVDDGWQTDDTNRGYAFTGDWEYSTNRFPNLPEHVKKVQAMGIKYLMWFSVPFVGKKSAFAYKRFEKMILDDHGDGTCVLDPRFPEVRDYLVGVYIRAIKDWGLDGLKLDFIDQYNSFLADPVEKEGMNGRDIRSIPDAVDVLMKRVTKEVTALKPDALIEFRQSYVGPMIRQYGNMLRVGDCPGSVRRNRAAIANLRFTSGNTAVHADMLEWNFKEDPEKSALFILNSLFGTVQYSVMLREAPVKHLEMMQHWIKFSQDHREALLKGGFAAHHAELMYPVVEGWSDTERVIGVYNGGELVTLKNDGKVNYLLNATGGDSLAFNAPKKCTVKIFDTYGKPVDTIKIGTAGLKQIACPCGGYAEVK